MEVIGVGAAAAGVAPITVGGAVASVGINMVMLLTFSLLTWWTMGDDEDWDLPGHIPDPASDYPLPAFLKEAGYERTINICVFGVTGSGKSSLVNALRPGDAVAAAVGVQETTIEPVSYNLLASDQKHRYDANSEQRDQSRAVRIWDLPGVGTDAFPSQHCVREMGLRYFDVVILLVAGNGCETELKVSEELNSFKVPHFIVRSQVDSDIENEVADNGISGAEAESLLREDMASQGFPAAFLVSSRHPDKYDFQLLVGNVVASVQARRRIRKADGMCPICFELFDSDSNRPCYCHWCRNCVCSACTEQLQGKLDETPCPFCRRWTNLVSAVPDTLVSEAPGTQGS